VTFLFFAFL